VLSVVVVLAEEEGSLEQAVTLALTQQQVMHAMLLHNTQMLAPMHAKKAATAVCTSKAHLLCSCCCKVLPCAPLSSLMLVDFRLVHPCTCSDNLHYERC
jgi:hypothetical protein